MPDCGVEGDDVGPFTLTKVHITGDSVTIELIEAQSTEVGDVVIGITIGCVSGSRQREGNGATSCLFDHKIALASIRCHIAISTCRIGLGAISLLAVRVQNIQRAIAGNASAKVQSYPIIHDGVRIAVSGQIMAQINLPVGARVAIAIIARVSGVLNTQIVDIGFFNNHRTTGTIAIAKLTSNG